MLFTNDKSIFLNINFGDEFETLSLFELGKNIILLLILASSESFAIKEQKVDAFDNPPINIKILNNKDNKAIYLLSIRRLCDILESNFTS